MFALQNAGTAVTSVSDSTGETWVHAPNCNVTSGSVDVDCWYVLSSTAGATTITATLNSSGNGRAVEFYEFSVGAGCFAYYDSSGSANDSAASTSQLGATLTLTGTNDVIVQGIYGGSVSSISGGYAEATGATNRTAASLLNTISGNAPTWTLGTSGTSTVNAIALMEACSVSITISPTQTTLYARRCSNSRRPWRVSQNTAVTWSIRVRRLTPFQAVACIPRRRRSILRKR